MRRLTRALGIVLLTFFAAFAATKVIGTGGAAPPENAVTPFCTSNLTSAAPPISTTWRRRS